MIDSSEISEILNSSPSAEILRLRNREAIIVFLVKTFSNQQGAISAENIHTRLADYLEFRQIENDDESEIEVFDNYEIKAKKYIQNWTNRGFLTILKMLAGLPILNCFIGEILTFRALKFYPNLEAIFRRLKAF